MIRLSFFIFLLFIVSFESLYAVQRPVIQTNEVVVIFDEPLSVAAKEVSAIYPALKSELETALRWKLDFRPTVLLVKETQSFKRMTGSDFFVAFAVPRKKLIVIDYSKMHNHPFTLGITLKHELCHLLLHHHIGTDNLPKWLDEGVAQWVSDGISELIMDKKRVLDEAILSGNYLPLNALTHRFPRDRRSVSLAYEESKSLVMYMEKEFGEDEILSLLSYLKHGDEIDAAIRKSFSISLDELEKKWRQYLRRTTTWLVYVAIHIYDILFFLTALTAIYGFIRLMIKKRAYKDEDGDGEDELF